jgi:hypothetical protein
MLGNCIHVKFDKRWTHPSLFLVLVELALNIFCLFASFNALYTVNTPIIKQQVIVLLVFYFFNLASIAFMYMDESLCMFGLVIDFVIFVVYIIYLIILHFKPEEKANIGWGYHWATLIFPPYLIACFGFFIHMITHMGRII